VRSTAGAQRPWIIRLKAVDVLSRLHAHPAASLIRAAVTTAKDGRRGAEPDQLINFEPPWNWAALFCRKHERDRRARFTFAASNAKLLIEGLRKAGCPSDHKEVSDGSCSTACTHKRIASAPDLKTFARSETYCFGAQLRVLRYPGPRSSMNINTVARMSRSKNA
jgi:hypothetical protein